MNLRTILSFLAIVPTLAAAQTAPTQPVPAPPEKASRTQASGARPKIGFILATLQEERYLKDRRYFEDSAKKLGADVLFASCNNSEATQASHVDNLISQGVKVLVIQAVNGGTAGGFVKQAKADGVKVVAYDRLIANSALDAFITEDAEAVGRLEAEAAVRATGGKGNYVILMGSAGDPNAADRTRGITQVLAKHPAIKIVAQQSHANWSSDLAMKTTENALTLTGNHVDAVLANNSGMAQGAIRALTDQKLDGKVFVAGADSDLPAIRNIVGGKQSADVLIPIQEMAENAARVAVALARNEPFAFKREIPNGPGKTVKAVETAAYLIDRSNIDQRIIASGFHSREAVYGKAPSVVR